MGKLAFVARRVKGEETWEDRLQKYSLSLQREVYIPGKAQAFGLEPGMEMDSTSHSSSTCYRIQRQRFFCHVLSFWWHWACLHEGISSCLFANSTGGDRGSSWGQQDSCGSQGKAAHLFLWQGLPLLTCGDWPPCGHALQMWLSPLTCLCDQIKLVSRHLQSSNHRIFLTDLSLQEKNSHFYLNTTCPHS